MAIRNFSSVEGEVPIFATIKLSNILYGLAFWAIPGMIAYKSWVSIAWGFWWVLALLMAAAGFIFSEYRKDGRKVIPYLKDKYSQKKTEQDNPYPVKKSDISRLVESLRE